jgi:hypothetical protein
MLRSPARTGYNVRRLGRNQSGAAAPGKNQRDDESDEHRSPLSGQGCQATGLLAYNALHQIALVVSGNQA